MRNVRALRDRLIEDLEAATANAIEITTHERNRPIAEARPTDATSVLQSVARIVYYDREYSAGARTVKKLALSTRQSLPTARRVAHWLLKHPENLPLASAFAEKAMLSPTDAHTDHERNSHRAAERWLRDFRKPYDGTHGNWTADRWQSFVELFMSDLVVDYLATKRQRQPLYDLLAAFLDYANPPAPHTDKRIKKQVLDLCRAVIEIVVKEAIKQLLEIVFRSISGKPLLLSHTRPPGY